MKKQIKKLFPTLYENIWYFRKFVKERVLTNGWKHYYGTKFQEPEFWLKDIKIPTYVDTILDLGCGNGRNFIDFNGKYRLMGIDIVPAAEIQWVRNFENLSYFKGTIQGFTKFLENKNNKVDLSSFLVCTFGTLMYLSLRQQRRFLSECKKHGCRNFIFYEEPNNSIKHSRKNFKLPTEWFKSFKPYPKREPIVYHQLDL